MTHEERSLIKDLEKCDFGEIHSMHKAKVEARKNMSKEEKQVKLGLLSLHLYAGVSIMYSVVIYRQCSLKGAVCISLRFWMVQFVYLL